MKKRLIVYLTFILFLILFSTIGLPIAGIPTVQAAEPICPGGSNPDLNVIWCDDFEDGTWLDTWSVSPFCCDRNGDGIVSKAETEAVICGSKGYQDNCTAWSEKYEFDGYWGFDGHYGNARFTFPEEFYIRWYVYVSDPFLWGTVQDKNLRIFHYTDPNSGTKSISTTIHLNHTTRNLPAQPQMATFVPIDTNWPLNKTPITLLPGKWYLLEWYVKLNSPGISNGITRLWVNDATAPITNQTLILEYTNVNFRNTSDRPSVLQLTPYHGNDIPPFPGQHVRWDNIVVSKNPIGPMGSNTVDKMPPSSPKGLTVK